MPRTSRAVLLNPSPGVRQDEFRVTVTAVKKWFLAGLVSLCVVATAAPQQIKSPILTAPAKVAAKEKKVVFVSFSASWCGPCRLLHKTLEHDPVKPIWDKYFTSVSVVVDESGDKAKLMTPGGDDLRKALNGDGCGIPFFAFLTPEGKVLGNSFADPKNKGSNTGCPMSAEEIAAFMTTLKTVVPKMTDTERKTIQTAFEAATAAPHN